MLSVAETREPVPWIINWQWLQVHMYRWRFQTSWKTGKKSQKQKPITEMNHSSGKLTNRFLTFWEVWKLDCLRMTSCRYFPPWTVPTEPHQRKRTVKKIKSASGTCPRCSIQEKQWCLPPRGIPTGDLFGRAWCGEIFATKRLAIRTRRVISFVTIELSPSFPLSPSNM